MAPARGEQPLWSRLQRYRGLAVLVGLPLLVVLIILLVVPRGPAGLLVKQLRPDTFSERAEQLPDTVPAGEGSDVFCIIFDAGSTGSRVHVYKFVKSGAKLDLVSDTFEQLKPGLSSYAEDPEGAAQSLRPLLDKALATVPEASQGRTRVQLGATAGLRLLQEGKADVILDHVRRFLAASPFQLDAAKGVSILDGADEGAFAWLTLNYLLGNLGREEADTVAAIDLGGGSVQQAYALTAAEAAVAPEGYVTRLTGGGRTYGVYVHSYLGFGLMAGRAAVLAWEETRAANPCVPAGEPSSFEYGGRTHDLVPHPEGATFAACERLVRLVLHQDAACGAPQDECAFNGAWGGRRKPTAFYVASYFWDRATEAGIITDPAAITWALQPADLSRAAERACAAPLARIPELFPGVDKAQARFLCLDLTFQHTLLAQGFRIPETHEVTLVKRVKYQSQEIEAAWPLGAAINLLG